MSQLWINNTRSTVCHGLVNDVNINVFNDVVVCLGLVNDVNIDVFNDVVELSM